MTNRTGFAPEIIVRIYRDGRLVEQRYCDDEAKAAEIMAAWRAAAPTEGMVSAEPHPRDDIVEVLRALADAIERQEPVRMPAALPPVRVQLIVDGTKGRQRGELSLLWQELAHPGA